MEATQRDICKQTIILLSDSGFRLSGHCRLVSQLFNIWFTGQIHLEQSYIGNNLFGVEGLSAALLYLDQGIHHTVQDYKPLHACKAAHFHTEISSEILAELIWCLCRVICSICIAFCT